MSMCPERVECGTHLNIPIQLLRIINRPYLQYLSYISRRIEIIVILTKECREKARGQKADRQVARLIELKIFFIQNCTLLFNQLRTERTGESQSILYKYHHVTKPSPGKISGGGFLDSTPPQLWKLKTNPIFKQDNSGE